MDFEFFLFTGIISSGIKEELKKEFETSSAETPSLIIVEILPDLSETIHL